MNEDMQVHKSMGISKRKFTGQQLTKPPHRSPSQQSSILITLLHSDWTPPPPSSKSTQHAIDIPPPQPGNNSLTITTNPPRARLRSVVWRRSMLAEREITRLKRRILRINIRTPLLHQPPPQLLRLRHPNRKSLHCVNNLLPQLHRQRRQRPGLLHLLSPPMPLLRRHVRRRDNLDIRIHQK